jgi:hypothetical protein
MASVYFSRRVGQGRVSEKASEIKDSEGGIGLIGNSAGLVQLHPMSLSVIKANGLNIFKLGFGPEQCGGGILAAGKKNKCSPHGFLG